MTALDARKVCPSLLLIQNETPGRVFELTRDVTLIGRNPECDITLVVAAVSKRHAQIVRNGEGLFVEDLDSRNFTFLDGERLQPFQPKPLKDGCEIQVCRFKLIFNNQVVRFQEDEPSDSTILGMLDAAAERRGIVEARPEEKLRAILEIGRDLRDTLSFKEVFERTLATLFKIFPQADRGFALLRSSKEATAGMSLAPQAIRHRVPSSENMAISRTVVNRVLNDGQAILSVNVAADERFQMIQSISGGAIRTMVCVPLLDRHRVPIGILQLDTADASARFKQDDLDLLLAVAEHIGTAVDNIYLHEDLMRRGQIEQGARDAWQVQKTLLPEHAPDALGYEFWDCYEPAQFVGGDYFDYVKLPTAEGRVARWALAMADVSGKGMPAALLMVKLATEFRLFAAREPDPIVVVERLNHQLCEGGLRDKFVTFLLAILDIENHRLTVVNAGHMPPLIRRVDGRIEEIGRAQSGTPLSVDRGRKYEAVVVSIEAGDVVAVYTDGVTDALNAQDDDFGGARLRQTIRDAPGRAEGIGRAILQAVRLHAAGRSPNDDITLLCLGRVAEVK